MPNQTVTLYPALNGLELATELRQLIASGHSIVAFSRSIPDAWRTYNDMALDLNPPIYDWLVVYTATQEEATMTDYGMHAYHFSLWPTGDEAIDRILFAVAMAGKFFHSTAGWTEEYNVRNFDENLATLLDGDTPVQWIQNAAYAAAEKRTRENQQ